MIIINIIYNLVHLADMEQSVSAFFLTNSIRIRGLHKSHKNITSLNV